MSTEETRTGHSRETDEVREVFSRLPIEEKLSAIIRLQLDLAGDIAEGVLKAVSRAADEMSRSFSSAEPRGPEGTGR